MTKTAIKDMAAVVANTTTVNVDDIRVPTGFNVRVPIENLEKHDPKVDTHTGRPCCYAHGIEILAEDIARNGLITPPVVRRIGKGGVYELIAGFRRMQALKLNKVKQVTVSVVGEISDEQAYLLNLTENMAREDLTPYEIAARCKFLSEKFKWSGDQIADRLGKSKQYVNNLIRNLKMLHPTIVEGWKHGDKRARTDKLNSYCAMKGKDGKPDLVGQLAAWEATAPAGSGGRTPGAPVNKSRPYAAMAHAKEVVEKDSTITGKVREAVLAALAFAMGESEHILGVSVVEEKALPKEAREAVEAQALAEAEELEAEVGKVTDKVTKRLS